jgi:hypothetical protein
MSSLPPPASLTPSGTALSARFPSLPADSSWTALLAATAWGVSSLGRRHVCVRQRLAAGEAPLRLVVQCYRESDTFDGRPGRYARPLGSAQRSVSATELTRGVQVDLVHFESEDADDVVVVAWVEPGEPDLEYDGLEARPSADTELARVEASNPRPRLQ